MFPKISKPSFRYDVWRLVNRKIFASPTELHHPLQVISDIDKTYLETTYDSLRSMAKIALEDAADKKTVDGAREFFRALKWYSPFTSTSDSAPLHFVSSSPPQLRGVLEHKIGRDLLVCASNSFKDQIYNIKKGKLSLLKHQVSYKVAALLSLIAQFKDTQHIVMIGDNAESDPLAYAWIKEVLAGRLNQKESVVALNSLNVPEEVAWSILKAISWQQSPHIHVHVAIRRVKQRSRDSETMPPACGFHHFSNYAHLALICYDLGLLTAAGWNDFIQNYYQNTAVDAAQLTGAFLSYQKKNPTLKPGAFLQNLLAHHPLTTGEQATLELPSLEAPQPPSTDALTTFQNWATAYLSEPSSSGQESL